MSGQCIVHEWVFVVVGAMSRRRAENGSVLGRQGCSLHTSFSHASTLAVKAFPSLKKGRVVERPDFLPEVNKN